MCTSVFSHFIDPTTWRKLLAISIHMFRLKTSLFNVVIVPSGQNSYYLSRLFNSGWWGRIPSTFDRQYLGLLDLKKKTTSPSRWDRPLIEFFRKILTLKLVIWTLNWCGRKRRERRAWKAVSLSFKHVKRYHRAFQRELRGFCFCEKCVLSLRQTYFEELL